MATPIGRLAAALGNDAVGLSANALVDLVIERLGLSQPGEDDAAEGTAEVESAEQAAAEGAEPEATNQPETTPV